MSIVLAPVAAGAAGVDPIVTKLPNGLTVLIQEDERFPLASLRLFVRAGSAYETADQAGISHLLEHMVFKGTGKRSPGKLAQEVESVGGYFNAATSFDYTVYMTDMPASQWALGLDVLKDMAFNASIDPEELAKEKNVVLAELERNEDTPDSRIFKSLQPLVWPGSTYARPIIGFRETVQKTSSEDIKNYIRRFYQPQSMLLVVCGQVKANEVLPEVEKLFGQLQNDRAVAPAPIIDMADLARNAAKSTPWPQIQVSTGKWNKVYVSLAFPTPGFNSPDAAALETLGHLLGGDKTSRLYRKFKYERQLVDEISVSSVTLERSGMLYIQASLDPDKLDAFWTDIVKDLASLKADAFNDEELKRARVNLEDSLYQAKETLSGLASKLGFFQFFENAYSAEEAYIYQVRNMDRQQIQQAIDNYMRPDRLSASMLAPASPDLPDQGAKKAAELHTAVLAAWPIKNGVAEIANASAKAGKAETIELGDGLKLVLLQDKTLPYTALNIIYQGGDALLGAKEDGLAELVSRTLTKGAGKRGATQIQDFLSERAAHMSASANRDLFTVSAKFPTRFSQDVYGLILDVLSEPAFSPEETAREKQNLIASIKAREDQPIGLAFRHIFPFLYTTRPYSIYHLGMPEQVAGFTVEQARAFWRKQRAQPWVMAVCGDFDPAKIKAMAQTLADVGKKEGGFAKRAHSPAPDWGKDKSKDLKLAQRNQAHILLVFKTPGQTHEDTAGLNLLRAVLAGQSGILFSELRDAQGLGYSVTAMLWQSPATGFLAFYIGTYPDKLDAALQGFKTVVERLNAQGIPATDIDKGKQVLVGEYYREHQSLSSRSQEAATLLAQDLPLSANKDLLQKAATLSQEDVKKLVQKYCKWDEAYLMRVLP
jgi:zinc protease